MTISITKQLTNSLTMTITSIPFVSTNSKNHFAFSKQFTNHKETKFQVSGDGERGHG